MRIQQCGRLYGGRKKEVKIGFWSFVCYVKREFAVERGRKLTTGKRKVSENESQEKIKTELTSSG